MRHGIIICWEMHSIISAILVIPRKSFFIIAINQGYNGMGKAIEKTGEVPPQFDCSRALEHYQLGMKQAEASGDFELAEQCCFMASKCEQNQYYISVDDDDDNGKIKNANITRISI